jgi:hypothetical protein
VTAVFATNCKAFELESSTITIHPNDVDWEGRLMGKKLYAISTLRENVDIRFLFF